MTVPNGAETPGQHWPGAQPAYRGRVRPVDEPSNGEIMRRLDDLQRDWKEDFTEIRQSLPQYVPRELYEARHSNLVARVDKQDARQDQFEERLRVWFRWVVASIVVPILLFVLQQWQNSRGGGIS